VPQRALGERGQGPLGRLDVGRDLGALARDPDPLLAEAARGGARQLERVGVLDDRVVAARFDPGPERELVDQLPDLRRGGVDHPQVLPDRLLQALHPRERLREAVHGRKRGAEVVAGEHDEAGELAVFGQECAW
jgi:hypothetical protein